MNRKIGPSMMEVSFAEGRKEGEQRGEQRGEHKGRLHEARSILRESLEARFGALPESLVQQIDTIEDPERLHRAAVQVSRLPSLADLSL